LFSVSIAWNKRKKRKPGHVSTNMRLTHK
jgi:hypothetical protein